MSANVAGKTADVSVGLNPRTGVTIAAPTTPVSAGQPATFTVGVGSTANIRDVTVDDSAMGTVAGERAAAESLCERAISEYPGCDTLIELLRRTQAVGAEAYRQKTREVAAELGWRYKEYEMEGRIDQRWRGAVTLAQGIGDELSFVSADRLFESEPFRGWRNRDGGSGSNRLARRLTALVRPVRAPDRDKCRSAGLSGRE